MGVGGWVSPTPQPPVTPGKTRYPLYRRLGGPQGRSGRAEILVRTGIRSRTVEPVVSRYTDWATGPTVLLRHVQLYRRKLRFCFYQDLYSYIISCQIKPIIYLLHADVSDSWHQIGTQGSFFRTVTIFLETVSFKNQFLNQPPLFINMEAFLQIL